MNMKIIMGLAAGLLLSGCDRLKGDPWEKCPEYETPASVAGPGLAKPALSCAPPPWYPWKKPAPAAYGFTYTRQCFCPQDRLGPFFVTMSGDLVTGVRRLAGPGDTVGVADGLQAFALETIWEDAQRRYWNVSASAPGGQAFIRHDVEWGFVDSFYIDPIRDAADDEDGMTITHFRAL